MSEYENAKQIAKRMRLGRKQAAEVGKRAYEADLASGRPDIALKCAKEFRLGDAHVTRAATALFLELIRRAQFPKALEIARSYNLAHGGVQATAALEAAGRVRYAGGGEALDEIRRLAQAAAGARQEASRADEAIELIRAAGEARASDPALRGRAAHLPDRGEVWLTGDLHGNADNLKRFAALADLDAHPDRFLVVQEIVHARLITADNRDLSFVAILEALRLQARYPGRVYFLLGNHDMAVQQNRELSKGGRFLNRYFIRGLAYMYKERHEDVLRAYQEFIAGMPAAVFAPNGVFMAHSTPKRVFVPSLTREHLEEAAQPLHKDRAVHALVHGRDYAPDTADAVADQLECDVLLCGHTPTRKGWKVPNHRHVIIDSQHGKGRYVRFDLATRYADAEALSRCVAPLDPTNQEELASTDELM